MQKELVKVNDKEVVALEWNGERVITTAQLAEVYGTDMTNVWNNFSNNKDRFEKNKHYFFLTGDSLRSFKNHLDDIEVVAKGTAQLYLWTRRGASRHCKILDTEMAWKQFDCLEENYFNPQHVQATITYQYPVSPSVIESATGAGRLFERLMKNEGIPPHEIAMAVRSIFLQAGIDIPDYVVKIPAYEQLSLDILTR